MGKSRLEAFSDGVLAIIITIMVLELHVPHGDSFSALHPLLPVFLNYGLSFIYVGIYWNNHHHLLHSVTKVSGGVLWANLNLLFWLSLLPFVTAWMGENPHSPMPAILYGAVLLICGASYTILERSMIRINGRSSLLAEAVGNDFKGYLSIALYAVGIAVAFWLPLLSQLFYASVAAMWLIPDRRIEKRLAREGEN